MILAALDKHTQTHNLVIDKIITYRSTLTLVAVSVRAPSMRQKETFYHLLSVEAILLD